jgi:predicted enzyme related to lactoylglutathione lyase
MTASTNTDMELIASVIDCADPRALAEFYGELLGWEIDEGESEPDWVELAAPQGGARLSFQCDPHFQPPTWPAADRPQMMHLDLRVASLEQGHESALRAGATPLPQPADRVNSNFRVYADPEGHPFCLCSC